MKYINKVTGEVIEVDASISGGFWEEVDETVIEPEDVEPEDVEPEDVEPEDVEKPKSQTTGKGRGKRA